MELKINWRNLNNGFMLFWNKIENTSKYLIEISIVTAENTFDILREEIKPTLCYYAFVNIGNGEYKVKITAIDERGYIICSQTKTSNFISIGNYLSEISKYLKDIISEIGKTEERLCDIENEIENVREGTVLSGISTIGKYDFEILIRRICERYNVELD